MNTFPWVCFVCAIGFQVSGMIRSGWKGWMDVFIGGTNLGVVFLWMIP